MHIDTNYNLKIKMGEANTANAPHVRVCYSKVISKTGLDTNAQAYTPETTSKATTTTSELEILPRVPLGQAYSRLKIHSIQVANRDTVTRTVFLYSEDEGGTEYYFVSGASVPAGATLWVAEDGSMGITPDSSGVTSVSAGSGLSNSGSATTPTLDVNVDNSTIEISADTLRVKANGIGDSHIRQSGARSVIGRSANSTGNVADISFASAAGKFLGDRGSTLGAHFPTNVQSKDVAYAITQDDYGTCFVCPTTASRTLTLPAPGTVGAGWWCKVQKTSSSPSNTLVVARNGSETIDGRSVSDVFTGLLSGATYITDGTNWFAINVYDVITVSATNVNSAGTGSWTSVCSTTINPGIWKIEATVTLDVNGATISGSNVSGINTSAADPGTLGDNKNAIGISNGFGSSATTTAVVLSSSATYHAVALSTHSAGTPRFNGKLIAFRRA